ncbi:hypothetical protein E2562_023617 [Oryza meyeriana var. granulata]|uniref:Uncharacterized protein n=1 Tax=Oryza meyeriana var. granulata TaxID=110450 RepID=A0A6G1FBD9_9ORYZ|nr:hypothetical protein E2562_023617 [Oryza meyeriana var. granulata]
MSSYAAANADPILSYSSAHRSSASRSPPLPGEAALASIALASYAASPAMQTPTSAATLANPHVSASGLSWWWLSLDTQKP